MDNRSVTDGMMILKDGLSSNIMNDTDILTPIQQIQMQITARVIANSAVSATAAVALRHLL